MAAAKHNQPVQPTLDTSDPNLWVLSFSPEGTGRISKSGMNETVLNLRTVAGDVVMNFQAYKPNPDYKG